MQNEERLIMVVGAISALVISALITTFLILVATASTHHVSYAMAAQDYLGVIREPEMVAEELTRESEVEEDDQEDIEEQEGIFDEILIEADESYISNEQEIIEQVNYEPEEWDGSVINPSDGKIYGPSGYETFYNLPMEGVVELMREMGYDEESYPYWVREDGAKMFGPYVMVAADLSMRPKGNVLECSLGTAMVCDTGLFVYDDPYQLDVAVTWVV